MMIKNPGKIKIRRYRRQNSPGRSGIHPSLLAAHEYLRLYDDDEEDEFEAEEEEYEDSEEEMNSTFDMELAGEIW